MASFMNRYIVLGIAALGTSACSVERLPQADDQPLMQMQGSGLQGIVLQGNLVAGMTMHGFRFAGATLGGAALSNFRLEKGELIGEQNSVTLRGAALVNAHLFAEAQNNNAHPPQSAVVEYRITAIAAEDPIHDPTNTGNTFLYTLEQNVDNTGTWQPAGAPRSRSPTSGTTGATGVRRPHCSRLPVPPARSRSAIAGDTVPG
jgi:hypothetical protein